MKDPGTITKCKSCGFSGLGDYCSRCGQSFKTKRITLPGLLHDVFHFFTHLEKGFLYTLKQLIVAPGYMQRNYIQGERSRHQKPFSMFFICATITALARYWIFNALITWYHSGNPTEAKFFHEYMVITYIVLLPVFAFITWLFFLKSGYNYAELGVLMLYTVSIFFLMAGLITLLKFIWPDLETTFVEFPVLTVYFTITLINFFKSSPRWIVIIKSLLIIASAYLINQVIEDFVVRLIA